MRLHTFVNRLALSCEVFIDLFLCSLTWRNTKTNRSGKLIGQYYDFNIGSMAAFFAMSILCNLTISYLSCWFCGSLGQVCYVLVLVTIYEVENVSPSSWPDKWQTDNNICLREISINTENFYKRSLYYAISNHQASQISEIREMASQRTSTAEWHHNHHLLWKQHCHGISC